MIERNNGIVVNEINTFRLLYKLMEKMRRTWQSETVMIGCLGAEVIRRVTMLKDCFETGVN